MSVGPGAAIALGLGMALVIEGVALALLTERMDRLMAWIAASQRAQRRTIGLAMVAAGVGVVWLVV